MITVIKPLQLTVDEIMSSETSSYVQWKLQQQSNDLLPLCQDGHYHRVEPWEFESYADCNYRYDDDDYEDGDDDDDEDSVMMICD